MTTSITLSGSWQEIAGANSSKLASFETDGTIFVALSDSEPTGENYHTLGDGDVFAAVSSEKLWAKKDDESGDSYAKVDDLDGLISFGSGLSLINVSANVLMIRGG